MPLKILFLLLEGADEASLSLLVFKSTSIRVSGLLKPEINKDNFLCENPDRDILLLRQERTGAENDNHETIRLSQYIIIITIIIFDQSYGLGPTSLYPWTTQTLLKAIRIKANIYSTDNP